MENVKDWIKFLLILMYKVFLYGFAFIGITNWYFTVYGGQKMENSTRIIALNIGEECEVYQTDAPTSRLLELEQESCEHCDEYDYESIPVWQKVLQDEGYTFDDVDLMYFNVTESRNEWLHTEFNCTEQYEIGYTVYAE